MKTALLLCCPVIALYAQPAGGGRVVRISPELDQLISPEAMVERVQGGFRFTEGPVWVKSGYLLFSDVMGNAILQWGPNSQVREFRKPVFSGAFPDTALIGSNGLTLDRQGRLLAAEHGNRRISRTAPDGSITTLADRYEGKRLNSPNDLIVKKNGDIYFTDPPALYRTYPPGANVPQRELDYAGLYRLAGGKLELLAQDLPYPNGLAFSPDEKKLYVANSRPDKFWMVYDVTPGGGLANGRKFADVTGEPGEGVPDGMKVDRAGNLYVTASAGLLILTPEGKRLGAIQLPELPANCAWGDSDARSLYITARTGIYRVRVKVAGVRP